MSTGLIRLRTGISQKGLPGLGSEAKEQQEEIGGRRKRRGNQLFLQKPLNRHQDRGTKTKSSISKNGYVERL